MKILLIHVFKMFLKFVYFFLKLLPTNNKKIVFLSRQSDSINIDFKMIGDELLNRDSNLKLVFICKRMGSGIFGKIKYVFVLFRQMYHLATSRVAVLDSYCIPVCILKHKKSLSVLQIWHSIGKIKKSGYQTLDNPSGRDRKVAEIMCMHKNYDAIIAGAEAFDEFYEKGFNVKRDVLLHYGLPRIDYLIKNQDAIRDSIYAQYPEFKNKKIVLYAPTFRTYDVDSFERIAGNYDNKDFVLIVKSHQNQILNFKDNKIYKCPKIKSIDLLTVVDYVITDYSSIALEAAVLNKKVLFYVYDYDKYMENNGLNIDFYKLLPKCSSKDIKKIFNMINNDEYDDKSYQKFRKKYLPKEMGSSTEKICNYIIKELNR